MAQFIYVTARNRRDLYESLLAGFEGQHEIHVIVDRRQGERRRLEAVGDRERRQGRERRQHRDLDMELRAQGSFVTDAADRAG